MKLLCAALFGTALYGAAVDVPDWVRQAEPSYLAFVEPEWRAFADPAHRSV